MREGRGASANLAPTSPSSPVLLPLYIVHSIFVLHNIYVALSEQRLFYGWALHINSIQEFIQVKFVLATSKYHYVGFPRLGHIIMVVWIFCKIMCTCKLSVKNDAKKSWRYLLHKWALLLSHDYTGIAKMT